MTINQPFEKLVGFWGWVTSMIAMTDFNLSHDFMG